MSAAILASLGLDRAPFNRDLNAAVQDAENFSGRFRSVNRGIIGTNDELLLSSHRAGRGIGMLAQQMAQGADASQLMGTGLMSLERSLHVPLGSLAGLAIGAVFFEQVHKAYSEATKLHQEIQDLLADAQTSGEWTSFQQLDSILDKLKGKYEELTTKQREATTPFSIGGLVQAFHPHQLPKDIKEVESGMSDEQRKKIQSLSRTNLERETGGFGEQRMKALHELMSSTEKPGTTQGEAVEYLRKYKDEIKEINRKEADGLQAAKETTMLQALELSGQTKLAEVLKTQLEYQKKINDAKREGEPAVAAELEKQRKLAAAKGANELYPSTSGGAPWGSLASRDAERDLEFGNKAKGIKGARDAARDADFAARAGDGETRMNADPSAEQMKRAFSTTEGILGEIKQNTAKQFVNE